MSKKYLKPVFIVIAIAAISALYLYLFRQESIDNPALGRITYKYQWGIGREMLVDANRDGVIDARAVIAGSFGKFWSSDALIEYWESAGCDGYFDVHIIPDPPGHSRLLEYDKDHDGRYETTLYDSDVVEFLLSLSRTGCGVSDSNGRARHSIQ